jgi:phosphohistidine phosphatase
MIESAQVFLLRHGVAGGKSESNTPAEDFVRPLTPKGVRQSVNAGKLLRRIAPKFDGCYTSPVVRCVQSAVLACEQLKGVKPKAKQELMSMSNSEGVALIKDGGCVLLVCHGPELDELVHHLTGRTVDTSRGTIAAVKITNGQGTLQTLLTPKQVAAMVKPSKPSRSESAAAAALSAPVTLACEPPRPARRVRGASRSTTRWRSRARR